MISERLQARVYSYEETIRIATALNQQVQEGLQNVEKMHSSVVERIPSTPLTEGLDKIGSIIGSISMVFKAANVDSVGLPSFLTGFNVRGNHVDEITMTVKSKFNAVFKVRNTERIPIDACFIQKVGHLISDVAFHLFYLERANHNIQILNHRLEQIRVERSLDNSLQFMLTTDEPQVVSIENHQLILKADLEQALKLDQYALGKNFDVHYNRMLYADAVNSYANMIRCKLPIYTLLKANNPLLQGLAQLTTKEKPSTLIRKRYHKKAENLKKEGDVGYYSDVIDGIHVFALVRLEEGRYRTILNPFGYTMEFDAQATAKANDNKKHHKSTGLRPMKIDVEKYILQKIENKENMLEEDDE